MKHFLRYLFRRKPKFIAMPTGEKAVEAFKFRGKTYYHFQDSAQIPAGRAMCALAIYEELKMRCNREYLEKHCRAVEIILSDPKRINIPALAILNKNLQERMSLVPFPDHIYKLASVTFFDDTENPNTYDFNYNAKKIAEWKKDPSTLHFFLQTPLKDLIPFTTSSVENAEMYFQVSEEIDKLHQTYLREQLSKAN